MTLKSLFMLQALSFLYSADQFPYVPGGVENPINKKFPSPPMSHTPSAKPIPSLEGVYPFDLGGPLIDINLEDINLQGIPELGDKKDDAESKINRNDPCQEGAINSQDEQQENRNKPEVNNLNDPCERVIAKNAKELPPIRGGCSCAIL